MTRPGLADDTAPPVTRPSPWPARLLAVGLLAQAVLVLTRVGQGWFGVDALHYLAQRGGIGEPTEGLMEPYAGHWQPVLVLVYRMLYEMFGLSTYLPYVVPALAVHLGLCVVLYRLVVLRGADRWAAASGCLVLAFFGAGSEVYLADAPVALTGAILLGLVAVLLLQRPDPGNRRLAVVSGLVLCAFMISMAAVSAVVLVAVVLVLRRRLREGLLVLAVPVLAFATWYAVLGRDAPRASPEAVDLLGVPATALSLLTAPLGSLVPVPGAGLVLTGAVVLAVLVSRRAAQRGLADLAVAGIAAAGAQSVLSSVASVDLGEGAVLVGRYQYVVLVYLVPGVVLALGELLALVRERRPGTTAIPAVALGAALLAGVVVSGLDQQHAQWLLTRAEADKARAWTTGGVAALALGERMLTPSGAGYTVHADDIRTLASSDGARWSSLKADATDRLAAESVLFTGVRGTTFELGAPARLSSSSFATPVEDEAGCQTLVATQARPQITVVSFDGAQVAVESASSTVTAVLSRDGSNSEARDWPVTPGQPTYIGTSAQLATLRLTFDTGGTFTVCSA